MDTDQQGPLSCGVSSPYSKTFVLMENSFLVFSVDDDPLRDKTVKVRQQRDFVDDAHISRVNGGTSFDWLVDLNRGNQPEGRGLSSTPHPTLRKWRFKIRMPCLATQNSA